MIISTRRRPAAMTLLEVLLASGLAAIAMTLVLKALVDVHRFYQRVSTQSRQVGSALLCLDRIEAMCFGLPREALTLSSTPSDGEMLVVQPFSTLAASGTAVYSSRRWVWQSNSSGVNLWEIQDETPGLGTPLSQFPPLADKARKSRMLAEGWRLSAEFEDGNFPLHLVVTPPQGSAFRRSVEGYH